MLMDTEVSAICNDYLTIPSKLWRDKDLTRGEFLVMLSLLGLRGDKSEFDSDISRLSKLSRLGEGMTIASLNSLRRKGYVSWIQLRGGLKRYIVTKGV